MERTTDAAAAADESAEGAPPLFAMKVVKRAFTAFYAAAVADEVASMQRLAAGGGHVHVVSALALWLSPSHLGIEMIFEAGGTLEQYYDRHSRPRGAGTGLGPADAAYFGRQVRGPHAGKRPRPPQSADSAAVKGQRPRLSAAPRCSQPSPSATRAASSSAT